MLTSSSDMSLPPQYLGASFAVTGSRVDVRTDERAQNTKHDDTSDSDGTNKKNTTEDFWWSKLLAQRGRGCANLR